VEEKNRALVMKALAYAEPVGVDSFRADPPDNDATMFALFRVTALIMGVKPGALITAISAR